MGHKRDCPDDYEARRTARYDADDDMNRHRYRHDCDHANEVYEREYRFQRERIEEEHAEQRRNEERRERQQRESYEHQQQEEQWRAEQEYAEQQEAAAYAEHIESQQNNESSEAEKEQ